jgi:hypothetical protein
MTLYYDNNWNDVYSSFEDVPSYRVDKVKQIKNTKWKGVVTINTYIFITSEDWKKKSASKKFVFLSENESLEELFLLWSEEVEKRDQEFKKENVNIIDLEKKKELEKLKRIKKEIETKIKILGE